MIDAIRGKTGGEQALCRCDNCAAQEVIPARHGHSAGFKQGSARPVPTIQDPSAVFSRLATLDWERVKSKIYCPKCKAKRHETKQQEAAMAHQTATDLRHPTREQKREIVEYLRATYDIKAERYIGTDTDITVAEAIGGGCMFGWVAEIVEIAKGERYSHRSLLKDGTR